MEEIRHLNKTIPILFLTAKSQTEDVVKGFKIGVTKWCRNNTKINTVWQRNYYEHIIRNEPSYHTITRYIINNPKKWNDDCFFN